LTTILLGVTLVLIVLLSGSVFLVCRYRAMRNLYLTSREVLEFRNGVRDSSICQGSGGQVEEYKFNPEFELMLNEFTVGKLINFWKNYVLSKNLL